jgi:zinc protease
LSTRLQLDIAERVLPSGLTLLAVRNPAVATMACVVSLDVRAGDEPADRAGLANLTGECLDEGTSKRDALDLASAVESIGGSLDGGQRGGTIQCPAENGKKGIALLREMVLEPSFPQREVARVRDEVLTEMVTDEDDPRVVAARRFRREVYGDHPLGRPSNGTAKTVAQLKPKDLRAFHKQWFRPAGGYVAAAGPEDPERIVDTLQKAFAGFRGKPSVHPDVREVTLGGRPRDVHLPMDREQVHVFLGHLGVRRVHEDYYKLAVMDHVLGTGPGFTSRCSKRLRDEQGLCYAVSAGITASAGEEPGMFTAYIGTTPEHRQLAVDGFLTEIERIRREPPTRQELEDVKDYLTGSFVFAFERNSNLAAYVIRAKRFGLGFDYMDRYPDIISRITRDDVQEVAERHLHPDRMVIVSAGASGPA